MFGYVTICKSDLKVCEYEAYRGIYCGLCKELGRQFGPTSRLNLSYDFAFLALVGLAVQSSGSHIYTGRCMLNPMKKRKFLGGESVKYSAFTSVIFTYSKLLDDLNDEKSFKYIKSLLAIIPFSLMRRKAKKIYPKLDKYALDLTRKLREDEKNAGLSLDGYADNFAKMLMTVFEELPSDEKYKSVLSQLGYHIGRWIYIIDACDDLEDDKKLGRFNPLIGIENDKNAISTTLTDSLVLASRAYELLEPGPYKGLLDNIIYMGLPMKQKQILFGKENKQ
ncbi:MAG: DUF5685 family protein [Bacillota bacterium]|nr:DUF5685 family protein [Bacillota bacterium]